jgi:hypothetical protein
VVAEGEPGVRERGGKAKHHGVPVREERLSQTPSNSFCVGGGKGYECLILQR